MAGQLCDQTVMEGDELWFAVYATMLVELERAPNYAASRDVVGCT